MRMRGRRRLMISMRRRMAVIRASGAVLKYGRPRSASSSHCTCTLLRAPTIPQGNAPTWVILGASGSLCASLGSLGGGGLLDACWAHPRAAWAPLEALLGRSWAALGALFGPYRLGPIK
eukprot:2397934-Pyramimonas_sp.AAC.1